MLYLYIQDLYITWPNSPILIVFFCQCILEGKRTWQLSMVKKFPLSSVVNSTGKDDIEPNVQVTAALDIS